MLGGACGEDFCFSAFIRETRRFEGSNDTLPDWVLGILRSRFLIPSESSIRSKLMHNISLTTNFLLSLNAIQLNYTKKSKKWK